MHALDDNNVEKVSILEKDSKHIEGLSSIKSGIKIVHNKTVEGVKGVIAAPDSADFVKWLHLKHSEVAVEVERFDKQRVLRSQDYWLPLVFLASDVSLPIYLNLVASYLYEKSKGLLKGESQRVHLSAIYEDKSKGVNKKFEYEGNTKNLQKIIKRFDVNKFMD